MKGGEMMKINRTLAAGLGLLTLIGGILGGNVLTQIASASEDTGISTASTSTAQPKPASDSNFDPTKGGHVGTNGVKEELLTGDTAAKVTAVAQAAVPGATVLRVETDAEGAKYEAHMKKSDGTLVTVKFDANYQVSSTEDGMK